MSAGRRIGFGTGVVLLISVVVTGAVLAQPHHRTRVYSTQVQASPTSNPMGYILDPPPSGYTPSVTANEAVAIASTRVDAANATSVTSTLVSFTDLGSVPVTDDGAPLGPPQIKDVPAWVVTVDGICVPAFVHNIYAPGPVSACAGHEYNVVIDAQTGAVIEGFSFR